MKQTICKQIELNYILIDHKIDKTVINTVAINPSLVHRTRSRRTIIQHTHAT